MIIKNNKKPQKPKKSQITTHLYGHTKKRKKYNFFTYLAIKNKKIKKPKKPQITTHLYRHTKKKLGIFLKKPTFNDIKYPIKFNFKLISEFLKKK